MSSVPGQDRLSITHPLILVSLAVNVASFSVPRFFFPDISFENSTLHSSIEAGNASISTLFGLLVLLQSNRLPEFMAPIGLGMIGHGIMGFFTAFSHPGEIMVGFHTYSMLIGGIFFGAVWSSRLSSLIRRNSTLSAILGSLFFIGWGLVESVWGQFFWPMVNVSVLPELESDPTHAVGHYSGIVGGINSLSAVGYFLSAAYVFRDKSLLHRLDRALLLSLGLTLASAGLMFSHGHVWSGQWWAWHSTGIYANCLLAIFIIYQFQNLLKKQIEQGQQLNQRISRTECRLQISDFLGHQGRLETQLPGLPDIIRELWPAPKPCGVTLRLLEEKFHSERLRESAYSIQSPIQSAGSRMGEICLYFDSPSGTESPQDGELWEAAESEALLKEIADPLGIALELSVTQDLLQRERQQLLAIFDGMTSIICVVEPTRHEILYANAAFFKEWGGLARGRKCMRTPLPDGEKCLICPNESIFQSSSENSKQWDFQDEETGRWYTCSDKAIQWLDGRKVRLTLANDVTDEYAADEDLRASEERFREIAENIREVFWIKNPVTGQFLYVSPAFETLFEKSLKEVYQDPNCWMERLHPEDRSMVEDALNDPENFVEEFQYRIFDTRNGLRYLQNVRHAVHAEDGSILRILGTTTDITRTRKAEIELKEAHSRLELAIRAGGIGVWEYFTETGRLVWDETMFQIYKMDPEAFGESIDDWVRVVHPDDLEPTRKLLQESVDTGKPFEAEFRIMLPDGGIRHLNGYGLMSLNKEGKVIRATGANVDLSPIKETQLRLLASNRELEQFAYAASHDLKEPLRGITGCLQLIERRIGDSLDNDLRNLFSHAVGGAERLQRLIDGLLVYSRSERIELKLQPVDLGSVAEKAVRLLQIRIEELKASVTIDSLPTIAGEPTLLLQLFQNLLSNALKFQNEGIPPHIHIHCPDSTKPRSVAVSDNGIGIEPQHFERIFLLFRRLHPSEKFEGTGIGLAVCRRIMERHNASIRVESSPGEGSTFWLDFPPVPNFASSSS